MCDDANQWVIDACLNWESNDPAELLEQLMADERCPGFGPLHHTLVGAALLTCTWKGTKEASLAMSFGDNTKDELNKALGEFASRATCVPGAACAKWGVCGAAASAGMAFAVLAQNAPLKAEGWSEDQLMVSRILEEIARAGAPRCCKRDSRIAVRAAIPWFNKYFGAQLIVSDDTPKCAVASKNSVCLGKGCKYFPMKE